MQLRHSAEEFDKESLNMLANLHMPVLLHINIMMQGAMTLACLVLKHH